MRYVSSAFKDGLRRILFILFKYTGLFSFFYIIATNRIPKAFFDTIAERPLQSYIFGLLGLSIICLMFLMIEMSFNSTDDDEESEKPKPE